MISLDFEWQTNEFMLYCRTTQLREKSMMAYEQSLKLFERWCRDEMGIFTVDKVTENVIRRYISELQERGKYTFYRIDKQKKTNYPERRRDYRKPISTATINNYIRNIRVFFNWLERNYIIKKNPMKRIRQLRANRQPKVYLTDDELRRLLAKFDRSYFSEHRDYIMILLMLDSQVAELCGSRGVSILCESLSQFDNTILHNTTIHLLHNKSFLFCLSAFAILSWARTPFNY